MLLTEKFQAFLHRSGHTRESFGRLMGVDPSLLSRLIPRDGSPPVREPRLSTLKRLVEASKGAIGFDDFCADGAFVTEGETDRERCPACGGLLVHGGNGMESEQHAGRDHAA